MCLVGGCDVRVGSGKRAGTALRLEDFSKLKIGFLEGLGVSGSSSLAERRRTSHSVLSSGLEEEREIKSSSSLFITYSFIELKVIG